MISVTGISKIHRRVIPFTLTMRMISLTTAPSLAAVLDLHPEVATAATTVTTVEQRFTERDFLAATNAARIANGVPPLVLNAELSTAAAQKVLDMKKNNYWDHFRPSDHKAPWDFMKEAGYDYKVAGENLARGFNSVQAITDAWMASPAHRANLLSDKYTDIGFADLEVNDANGNPVLLTVQMFGSR